MTEKSGSVSVNMSVRRSKNPRRSIQPLEKHDVRKIARDLKMDKSVVSFVE